MFDYIGLQEYLNYSDDLLYKKLNVNIFQKAYVLLKLNRLYDAYTELERISNKTQNNNNLIFVLSEYNRLQIGDMISQNHFKLTDFNFVEAELKRIRNSIKEIKIEYLINNYLTFEEQKIIKKKLNTDNIIEYKNKLLKLSDNIDEKVINLSGNEYCHINLYKDYILNFIFIENNDLYREVIYYSIKTMLQDIKNIKDDSEQDSIVDHIFRFSKVNEYKFCYLDIYFMIEFLNTKQLKKVFDISGLDVIFYGEKEQLFNAYKNLVNSIIKLNLQNEYKYKEYVRKFFIIFSELEISQIEFTKIITLYIKLLRKFQIYPNDVDLYKYLMDFIIEQYNNTDKRKNINVDILEKLLICIYKKTIKHYDEQEFIIKNALNRVITNLSNIIKNIDSKYKLPIKKLDNIENISYIEDFYIPMYSLLHDYLKNTIKQRIHKSLKKNFSINLFSIASLNKIIKANDNYESYLVKETISKIESYYERIENLKTESCGNQTYIVKTDNEKREAENAIGSIADLINFGIIKNKLKYFDLLKFSDFYSTKYLNFVIDMKNFDYNKFEVSYIHYLTPTKMKELKSIINNNKIIKKIIEEKISNQININCKFNDTYMKDKILYILFNESFLILN